VCRADFGLPASWDTVSSWLGKEATDIVIPDQEAPIFKQKCPELLVMKDYNKLNADYWKKFPFNPLRTKVSSQVSVVALSGMVNNFKHRLTDSQLKRAYRAIEGIRSGMSTHQVKDLPGVVVKNTDNTITYGKEISDAVAHWVKSGFASGPFNSPPLDRFRVNCLMAIPQEGKVRPVLNVSAPKGRSLNDNADLAAIEKIKMSSAREFGYLLVKCGKNAKMSKSDVCDAYKLIPVPLEELRNQGFVWGGKYFVENSQIFGANSAPSNFDQVNGTIVLLAILESDINKDLVLKHLDDVLCAAPGKSDSCERFTKQFKETCQKLNVKLQPVCPKNEKAFENADYGKVLGTWFFTKELEWKMAEDKKNKCLRSIKTALESDGTDLLEIQSLIGNLNNVSLMCPFLKAFRWPINRCLSECLDNPEEKCQLSDQAKLDLRVWVRMLTMDIKLPIPREPCEGPPVHYKLFASDAAGRADDALYQGQGVASVGFNEDGHIILAVRKEWSKDMISNQVDVEGKRFGNKTAFLEMVGILIPMLMLHKSLRRQHVVFKVDNIACVHGWKNRNMKEDVYSSIVIRTIFLVAMKLETCLHVIHVPRKSDWEGDMVDRMSRRSTMWESDRKLLASFGNLKLPDFLEAWLDRPTTDWDICQRALDFVSA